MNFKNLNYKDSVIILKTIQEVTKDLYDSNKNNILNAIVKSGNYQSEFGQFFTRTTNAKTVNDIIEEKQAKIEKLQKEIDLLKMQKPNSTYSEKTIILNSKYTELANDIAKDLIKDIIDNINNKTISSKYAKL